MVGHLTVAHVMRVQFPYGLPNKNKIKKDGNLAEEYRNEEN